MTETDLKNRVWRHNALQIASGIAATLIALVTWPLSFFSAFHQAAGRLGLS
jgi:hypothetical protein